MKKLLTLAILTISLTSCETSEMNYNEPINQTQQNVSSARAEEITDEEIIADAILLIQTNHDGKELEENQMGSRIRCSSNLTADFGHACVQVGNSMVSVTWNPEGFHQGQTPPDPNTEYHAVVVKTCSC